METVTEGDIEVTVVTIFWIFCIIDFGQTKIVTGIKHNILILVGKSYRNTQIY